PVVSRGINRAPWETGLQSQHAADRPAFQHLPRHLQRGQRVGWRKSETMTEILIAVCVLKPRVRDIDGQLSALRILCPHVQSMPVRIRGQERQTVEVPAFESDLQAVVVGKEPGCCSNDVVEIRELRVIRPGSSNCITVNTATIGGGSAV